MRGKYIVIEGNDGTGKSTQVAELRNRLHIEGIETLEFHEPAGTPISDAIRDIIKNGDLPRDPRTNLLLFTAARLEIWKKVDPLLESGMWAISARNYLSTFAYQGAGEGLDPNLIASVTELFLPESYSQPDLTVILASNPRERIKRLLKRDGLSSNDTFERRGMKFQQRIDDRYLDIANNFNLPVVAADQPIEEVAEQIWALVEPLLEDKTSV
ncbi:MAG TPA: dTMP kinase [Patescibacteria group bacterium]|jgi:dTMP kinase|nr:dTMP kinase [Patescibacteria group bacterium]